MVNEELFDMKFADGTIISVSPDGSGNWLSDEITKEMLSAENLSHIEILVDGNLANVLEDQVCEGIYEYNGTYGFFLRDKTEVEQLREENEILAEAIVELAELLGGE